MSRHPAEAAALLSHADDLDVAVRRRSRWCVRAFLIFGAGAFASTLAIGLFPGAVGAVISSGLWVAVVLGLSVYAVRQPVGPRGFALRHGLVVATWGVLYSAVLALGVSRFSDELAWWLPGAVVVSLPGLAGAFIEARR